MDNQELWEAYVYGKQTYSQLALEQGVCARTIQRHIDLVKVGTHSPAPDSCIVGIDTSYFGRTFGVMLFKDLISGANLHWTFVKNETIQAYKDGIAIIIAKGIAIEGVVCDGKPGLLHSFLGIPTQMCQFHQVATVTRYITRKPRMQAAVEFKHLVHFMVETDRESFEGMLAEWYQKWEWFLDERTINPISGRSTYTHKRLRSAYKSVKRNLPWLFTWYDHIALGIPNTNNQLEGTFTALKNKLRNHNGLNMERKQRFINEFLRHQQQGWR